MSSCIRFVLDISYDMWLSCRQNDELRNLEKPRATGDQDGTARSTNTILPLNQELPDTHTHLQMTMHLCPTSPLLHLVLNQVEGEMVHLGLLPLIICHQCTALGYCGPMLTLWPLGGFWVMVFIRSGLY